MKQTLRDLRKTLKLTQEEFGQRVGVSGPVIVVAEKHGRLSDSLKQKIESEFKIELETNNNLTSSDSPAWLDRLESMWKAEVEFLKVQIERKDRLIDAMTEKLVKVEVANWPPMHPVMGGLGLATEVQLRAA